MTFPSNNLLLPSEQAKLLRDEGMLASTMHAEVQNPLWPIRAYDSLKRYLNVIPMCSKFMTEDFRIWAETQDNLPAPPTGRAYGSIMTKAFKAGLIEHRGYASTSNPKAHRTPASMWSKTLPF